MEATDEAVPSPVAGMKRPLEAPPVPTEGAPSGLDHVPEPASAGDAVAPPAMEGGVAGAPPAAVPTGAMPSDQEEAALQGEAAWLRQQNASLQSQLAALQQQHQALTAAATAAASMPRQAPTPAPAPAVRHNSAWTEQVNPENGATYYWNSQSGESTYTRPPDFNPGAATVASSNLPNTKGPPGANLFVVRKMRRGEYDEFNDEDLRREFARYGNVTRAEMTIDKENGWSKGFGTPSLLKSLRGIC